MKWSITQLRKYQDKPFEFNQTANFEHLIEPLGLIDLSEINVEGELTVKSNEVIADMHLTGTYTMPCARTLVPVEVPLDVRTSEIFDLEGYDSYTDEEVEEDEHYHLATDGMINIRNIAKELVIIEKPMRAYSENSIKCLQKVMVGKLLTKIKRSNLKKKDNNNSQTQQVDPRLQKLQQLYDKE